MDKVWTKIYCHFYFRGITLSFVSRLYWILRSDCRPFFLLRFKFAAYGSFSWKLNRFSYGVQFGINCTARDESKLSNFVECTTIIGNHTVWVQFGINLHEWGFQTAEIARAASASAILAFWKTHKFKLIPNWTRRTVWLLINNTNMKKFARKKVSEDVSWSHYFRIQENFFQSFRTNILSLLYMISLAYKSSQCLSQIII